MLEIHEYCPDPTGYTRQQVTNHWLTRKSTAGQNRAVCTNRRTKDSAATVCGEPKNVSCWHLISRHPNTSRFRNDGLCRLRQVQRYAMVLLHGYLAFLLLGVRKAVCRVVVRCLPCVGLPTRIQEAYVTCCLPHSHRYAAAPSDATTVCYTSGTAFVQRTFS